MGVVIQRVAGMRNGVEAMCSGGAIDDDSIDGRCKSGWVRPNVCDQILMIVVDACVDDRNHHIRTARC